MRRQNILVKILVLTNMVSLVFLAIVSCHYQAPQEGFDVIMIGDSEVVMIGDSITYGGDWKSLLNNENVVNLGRNGDTTDGVLNRKYVFLSKPTACFIMIGINDFQIDRSVEAVLANYWKIVTEIKNQNIRIIIQSVLHLGEKYYINRIGGKTKDDWKEINEKVKRLNQELETMAIELEVEFLDINKELSSNNILKEIYGDETGIHLSMDGYKKWAEIIQPIIDR
jgi:lysophospholipase L1-like esterase